VSRATDRNSCEWFAAIKQGVREGGTARAFGPEREEVAGGCRMLRILELPNFDSKS
jgi:hypothetical protein